MDVYDLMAESAEFATFITSGKTTTTTPTEDEVIYLSSDEEEDEVVVKQNQNHQTAESNIGNLHHRNHYQDDDASDGENAIEKFCEIEVFDPFSEIPKEYLMDHELDGGNLDDVGSAKVPEVKEEPTEDDEEMMLPQSPTLASRIIPSRRSANVATNSIKQSFLSDRELDSFIKTGKQANQVVATKSIPKVSPSSGSTSATVAPKASTSTSGPKASTSTAAGGFWATSGASTSGPKASTSTAAGGFWATSGASTSGPKASTSTAAAGGFWATSGASTSGPKASTSTATGGFWATSGASTSTAATTLKASPAPKAAARKRKPVPVYEALDKKVLELRRRQAQYLAKNSPSRRMLASNTYSQPKVATAATPAIVAPKAPASTPAIAAPYQAKEAPKAPASTTPAPVTPTDHANQILANQRESWLFKNRHPSPEEASALYQVRLAQKRESRLKIQSNETPEQRQRRLERGRMYRLMNLGRVEEAALIGAKLGLMPAGLEAMQQQAAAGILKPQKPPKKATTAKEPNGTVTTKKKKSPYRKPQSYFGVDSGWDKLVTAQEVAKTTITRSGRQCKAKQFLD